MSFQRKKKLLTCRLRNWLIAVYNVKLFFSCLIYSPSPSSGPSLNPFNSVWRELLRNTNCVPQRRSYVELFTVHVLAFTVTWTMVDYGFCIAGRRRHRDSKKVKRRFSRRHRIGRWKRVQTFEMTISTGRAAQFSGTPCFAHTNVILRRAICHSSPPPPPHKHHPSFGQCALACLCANGTWRPTLSDRRRRRCCRHHRHTRSYCSYYVDINKQENKLIPIILDWSGGRLGGEVSRSAVQNPRAICSC